jgi:hypothetical protein
MKENSATKAQSKNTNPGKNITIYQTNLNKSTLFIIEMPYQRHQHANVAAKTAAPGLRAGFCNGELLFHSGLRCSFYTQEREAAQVPGKGFQAAKS